MTLYFDTKAQFLDGYAVSTVCCWHLRQPIFAVASYNQDRGACVTIFDDSVIVFLIESLYFFGILQLFCLLHLFKG